LFGSSSAGFGSFPRAGWATSSAARFQATFDVTVRNSSLSLYSLQLDFTDPPSCLGIRRFEPQPGLEIVADPAFTVVLIHGWQPFMKCRGSIVPGFDYFDEYHPDSSWNQLAVQIKAKYPNANVRYVRYSTTAPPAAAGSYIVERLTALNTSGSTGSVVLIGHSMGGLVARYAALGDRTVTRIARIITLGTPHLGTPAADPADVALFFPSEGFRSLGSDVVQKAIPLPAPVPTYAIRGGVECGLAGVGSAGLVLEASRVFLCARGFISDGIVPSYSSIPPGVAGSFVPPYAQPGNTGVHHGDLATDRFVGDKVVDWLAPFYSTPALRLSSTAVSFGATAGGANPTPTTVQVTNAGTGTLSGLSVSPIGYDFVPGQQTGGCLRR
jgi:pimeloyl-ACP methyl ester carboxylesterase